MNECDATDREKGVETFGKNIREFLYEVKRDRHAACDSGLNVCALILMIGAHVE